MFTDSLFGAFPFVLVLFLQDKTRRGFGQSFNSDIHNFLMKALIAVGKAKHPFHTLSLGARGH